MYSLPVSGRYFLVCSAWGSGFLMEERGRKMSGVQDKFRGSYRGSLLMRDQLILFSMKWEFRKLFFLIRPAGFAWSVKNLNCLTITHPYKWLESSIESDLGRRIAIWGLDVAFHDFAFFRKRNLVVSETPCRTPNLQSSKPLCLGFEWFSVKNPYAIYLRTSKRLSSVV